MPRLGVRATRFCLFRNWYGRDREVEVWRRHRGIMHLATAGAKRPFSLWPPPFVRKRSAAGSSRYWSGKPKGSVDTMPMVGSPICGGER